MKRRFWLTFLFCSVPSLLAAQFGMYQHGSVVRMHMGDCMLAHHGMMVAFGPPAIPSQDSCPEYTLVSANVVYVIVGKTSNQLIPLAEIIDFRLHRNELAVRVDDAKHESKFAIKEMITRSEWDRVERHIDAQMKAAEVREAER
ncbi:MAG: hypothetical protein WB523_20255 [Candidatus Sulfotelmatobacter sp.]